MRRLMLVSAVTAVLVLSGCTPDTASDVDPSVAASPSTSGEPSTEPSAPADEPIALPDCDTIYSPAVVAILTSEGRSPLGDVSAPGMGGWGTNDPAAERILVAIDERISCTWILPATESGSTTSIARLDEATRAALVAALTTAGFEVAGDRFTIDVETEVGTYNETHLLTDDLWIGTFFSGGDSALLTDDAATQLLP